MFQFRRHDGSVDPNRVATLVVAPVTVLAATTLPVLLLGGEVAEDQDAQFAAWEKVLGNPQVRGMVVGRSLLYPPDGDVAAAVDAVVGMM